MDYQKYFSLTFINKFIILKIKMIDVNFENFLMD